MPISHAIAHHLASSTDAEARLSLRPDELAIDEASASLLATLKNSFLSRISRELGSFDSEEPSPLARELESFLAEEASFSKMTEALMEWLKEQAAEKRIELDADFLFFVEKSFDNHLFYLFVARRSESLRVSDELEITPSYAVDTGSSLFGIKVDLAEWKQRKDYAYLSLLPPRGNAALTESFYAFTGFSNGLDKSEATLSFLEGVETFARQMPEEQQHEYRNQVVNYCMEQDEQDAPVDIAELSRALDGIDADAFTRHMMENRPETNNEVMMDRRSLQRYVKFSGRERDLAISFSSQQLNSRVQYDAANDILTIKGLPRALRQQLLSHLQKG